MHAEKLQSQLEMLEQEKADLELQFKTFQCKQSWYGVVHISQ